MRYLIYDISSVLYRTFFQNKSQDVTTSTGLAHHMALMSLRKFYNKFKPHKLIFAFDRPSWRKDYTGSDLCISPKKYKGNRRQKMTPKEKEKFRLFLEHMNEFEELMRTHTSIVCLAAKGLEADDLIAGFCEAYGSDGEDEVVVISRDRDLAQMLGEGKDTFYPNIQQWDPVAGKEITIETAIQDLLKDKKRIPHELCNVDFFLFAKKIRGDMGDHVQASYPGVKKPRIIKSWHDSFERVNLLNHTWTHESGRNYIVKDLFEEGELLMDLRMQPDPIRKRTFETILHEMENPGSFSYFHMMAFLGKYELKDIAKSLDQFTTMLSR